MESKIFIQHWIQNQYIYQQYVYKRILKDADDCYDLLMEVFYKLYSKLDKLEYRGEAQLRKLIYESIRNHVIDDYRRCKSVQQAKEDYNSVKQYSTSEITIDYEYLIGIIEKVLKPMERKCILLFVEDYSYLEISDILFLPMSQVKTLIFRSRIKLSEYLGIKRNGKRLSYAQNISEFQSSMCLV